MSGSDKSSSDDAGANTRCCPKKIAQVVSKFGGLKRKLIADICFKGMLKVPDIGNLDKKFSLSLLQKIDIKKRAIKLNNNTFITICPEIVHHFLDIPNGPNKLFGLEDRSPDEKMDFIRFGIGSSTFDVDAKNSLKASEEIVTADYPNGMSEFQCEQFKVSFVCFSMGNFLVAKYSSNHGSKDYWGSLLNTGEISSYSFCQAVVHEIMESARHVQRERKANKAIKNVSGCLLLLQAMFLDSLNLGILNIGNGPSPRIQSFTFPVLQEMKIYLRQNPNTIRTKDGINTCLSKGEPSILNAMHMSTEYKQEDKITIIDIPSTSSAQEGQIKYVEKCLSSGMKVKEKSDNICSFVNTIKTPRSTEYLTAYSKKGFEKKINVKQLDALRLHNARMKLLINKFKSSTLGEMDCSVSALVTCKEVFNLNVNKLLEDILDQVLVLSKSMHDHGSVTNPSVSSVQPLMGSEKRSYENLVSGHYGGIDGAPLKKEKRRTFEKGMQIISGKNLIHDLTGEDDAFPDTVLNTAMASLDPGFVTPHGKTITKKTGETSYDTTSIESEKIIFPKMEPSISADILMTPKHLTRLNAASPAGRGQYSDTDVLDDLIEDTGHLDFTNMLTDNSMTYSPIVKILLSKGSMAKNPWFYGVARDVVDKEAGETLKNWLAVTKGPCLDSWWIIHKSPSLKKIAGNDFKSVFTRGHNFSEDLFDVAIRKFGQTDRHMYGFGRKLRWMHPFESDFARKVLNDEDYLNSKSVRLQLTGKSDEYNISQCRMVAVPNLCNGTWSSYFWDMKDRTVHVVDPTFELSRACELHDLHAPIVDKLQGAIIDCFSQSYMGWEVDWESWSKIYVPPFLAGKPSNESGLLTLLALRKFNGTRFEVTQTEGSLESFERELLYDMLSIDGNSGILPDVFIQIE